MASGTDEALEHAGSILSALSEKLYVLRGGCGAGSGVKMVNQLLAGVHIASAAEAMAFGARPGLNLKLLFDIKMEKNKSETGCQEVGLMGVGSSQNGVGINHPGAVAAGYVSGGAAAIGAGNSGAVAGGSGVLLVVLLPVALVVLVLLGTVIPLVCKSIHGKSKISSLFGKGNLSNNTCVQ
ncbi:hypothetical protein POM88_010320 [Heracleum sosnowskyi]|uniref:3-hydroxyisobutyrate dehydrogenase-like NAD-binding domain-containing protein n=1 Tax=Heracleum sosnowskyi TaxID=360622 RepID=A0AAD8MZU2_9APIA|nr:hypothetical protein POM88_010320 [Heracleum sosnowskyi]